MRVSPRDLRLGSGLTANRINLPYASELYLAPTFLLRSPRPALCYRPLLTLLPNLAIRKVIALEPRTPHQPEKLKKLSKNNPVVRFLFFSSTKFRVRNYLYFQSSAARPQAPDRIWCNAPIQFAQIQRQTRSSARSIDIDRCERRAGLLISACENRALPAPSKGFRMEKARRGKQ